jgi:CRISPR-associated protein Cas6
MSLLGTMQRLGKAGVRPGGDAALAISGMQVFDLSFELEGTVLPHDYPRRIEAALLGALPWAADDPVLGVHRVRAPLTEAGYLLSKRSRLTLRTVESRLQEMAALSGRSLEFGAAEVALGRATAKPVLPFPTLRAQMVVNGLADEQAFMDDIGMQLEVLGVKAEAMCGRPATIPGLAGTLSGFALVVHELRPEHSLRLQAIGLGPARRLGCGLFVHHKIIDGLDASPE